MCKFEFKNKLLIDIAPALPPPTVTYCKAIYSANSYNIREEKSAPHLVRISPKRSDILMDPLQRRQLIPHPEIERSFGRRFGALRKSERAHAIVDADVYDRSALWKQ